MNRNLRNILIKYGCSLIFCGLCIWGVLSLDAYSADLVKLERYRILCDAFMVPGALLFLVGLLVWLSGEGAMDGLTWAVTNMVKSLIPGLASRKESFVRFKERRSEKKIHGYGFLLIVGAVFLVVSVVFLLLYLKEDGTI